MKKMVRTHKNLDVWKEGIELVLLIYGLIKFFPKEERYGLVDQRKKSAVSIPSNIAEGAARNSNKEFIQFLYIALGSLAELETQLIIAKRLDFLKNDVIFEMIEREKGKLLGLIRYMKGKQ